MDSNRTNTITMFLLRVVAGLLLFQPGAMKLFGWYGGMPGGAKLELMSQTGIGGIIEVVCGIAIMLGLFTRPLAFLASGEMAVAYWQFHFPKGAWPLQNNGGVAVLLCFIFLFFAATGAGPWSLDRMISKKAGRG